MIGQVKNSDQEKQYGLLSNKGIYQVKPSVKSLLNDYTGAAAAYSLALLYDDYTGDAITVRRASDNATQNIGFDGQDLEIAALESFCSGTDGFITTWYDQSGNANNATQTTASSQPKIVSAGSVILENGKPTIDFDGVNDYFDLNNFSSVTTVSQFVVLKPSANNVEETFTSIQDNTTSNGISLGQGNLSNQAKFGLRNYQGADIADAGIAMSVQRYLLTGFTTVGTTEIFANSIQGLISGRAKLSVAGDSQIGADGNGNNSFSGNLQSVIIYDSDQSSNRTGIETALNDYYNIF